MIVKSIVLAKGDSEKENDFRILSRFVSSKEIKGSFVVLNEKSFIFNS